MINYTPYNENKMDTLKLKKLFEPFFKGLDSEEYEVHLVQLQYDDKTNKQFYISDDKSKRITPLVLFPLQSYKKKDHFFVEFWISLGKERGYFNLKHSFHLDLDILIEEIKKIKPNTSLNNGDIIAEMLEKDYIKNTHLLKDFNGEGNDYPKIAELVCKREIRITAAF